MHKVEKLYNTQGLLDFHRGDEEFVKHIASLFVTHMPASLKELKKADAVNDLSTIYFHAHKMKSSIDLFGVKSLTDVIRRIEQQAKYPSSENTLSADIKYVESMMQQCVAQIKKDFNVG